MFDLVQRNHEDANRVIVGTALSFDANNSKWLIGDKPTPPGSRLVIGGITTVAQRWKDKRVLSTVWPDSGLDLGDVVEEGNESIPESEWEIGTDGKKKAPWSISRVVYLVDTVDARTYTFASATVGAKIGVDQLRTQAELMQRLRGAAVIPEIELGVDTFMTRFGTRKPRPDFVVTRWISVGGQQTPQLALTQVAEPTRAEEMDDSIPY
jgi:hypothetical protein